MADIITRSIPAIPYQGGIPRTAQPYSAAVQLTPTRMVWTYCQTSPNWRFFVIIDTPEGWANGGTPAVTVSRMQDQKAYRGQCLQMARLNDNAFIIMDLQENASATSATAWSYEVFEIDANNVFTRTASNLNAYDVLNGTGATGGNPTTPTGYLNSGQATTTNAKYNNPMTLVPLTADNVLIWAGFNSTTVINSTTITYNPTTKALTFGNGSLSSTAGWSISSNGSVSMEVYWRAIPGSTKKAITYRSVNAGNSWTNAGISNSTIVINGDGSFYAHYPVLSNVLGNANAVVGQDMLMLSDNRAARVNWNWAYYYGLSGGAAGTPGTPTNDGFGSYTSTTSTNPMIALPMDANYMMLMDRTHFVSNTSGNIKMKIVRRDDANFVSQSTGSAASATGFDVTAPWIETWRHDARPRMMANGDIFWWGLDASGALAWNIIKNAA